MLVLTNSEKKKQFELAKLQSGLHGSYQVIMRKSGWIWEAWDFFYEKMVLQMHVAQQIAINC